MSNAHRRTASRFGLAYVSKKCASFCFSRKVSRSTRERSLITVRNCIQSLSLFLTFTSTVGHSLHIGYYRHSFESGRECRSSTRLFVCEEYSWARFMDMRSTYLLQLILFRWPRTKDVRQNSSKVALCSKLCNNCLHTQSYQNLLLH